MANNIMTLLPPPKDKCQVCASVHEPYHPHNAHSLYYQTKFRMENGRSATWNDALEHCEPELKKLWKQELLKEGIDIEKGDLYPKEKK